MYRNSSFMQLLRLAGIFPDNMFLELSNSSKFIKAPISMGRTPINWLVDKFRKIGENERPMTCEDIKSLRLLFARFKENKF